MRIDATVHVNTAKLYFADKFLCEVITRDNKPPSTNNLMCSIDLMCSADLIVDGTTYRVIKNRYGPVGEINED